jgi:ABC-type Fe3+-hydroxamate transport system substrate-binding protein
VGAHPRVVSLVPSLTETLLAWGVEPIGVTRFCEQPGIDAVGGTKDPNVERIVGLAPDLVVANDEENRKEDVEALRAAGVEVLVLTVESLADLTPAMDALAAAVHARRTALDLPPPLPHRRRAFVPIWRRPWMTLNAQTYGSSMLDRLGVANVAAVLEPRYPEVDLTWAAAQRPDVVLAPSEPYPFGARHVDELAAVAPVVLVDGQDLFWWGARTPAALARLAEHLA